MRRRWFRRCTFRALTSWSRGRSAAADGTGEHCAAADRAALPRAGRTSSLSIHLLTGNMVRGYELVRDTWRGVVAAKFAPPPPFSCSGGSPRGSGWEGSGGQAGLPVPGAKPVVGCGGSAGAAAVAIGCGCCSAAPGAAPAAPGAALPMLLRLRPRFRKRRSRCFPIARSASRFTTV